MDGEPMSTKPLNVLLCAENRMVLQHTTKLLEALGYYVIQTCDASQVLAAAEALAPDFVILDSQIELDFVRTLLSDLTSSGRQIYSFLLMDSPEANLIAAGLQAGIDDFLVSPIVVGELLARLRAGARSLEHQRRVQQQLQRDPATGLLTERAIARRIAAELAAESCAAADHNSSIDSVNCVAWNVDFFTQYGTRFGEAFAREVRNQIISLLKESVESTISLGHAVDDQFFAILAGVRHEQSLAWAEKLRSTLENHVFSTSRGPIRVTASFGVAQGSADTTSPDDLLRRAVDAQRLSKRLGRNCVTSWESVGEEENWWNSLADPEMLFERTAARDFMKPWTMVIRQDLPLHQARILFEQTKLSTIPVVNEQAEFVGICYHESIPEGLFDGTVRDVMESDLRTVDADTSFSTLFQLFENGPEPLVVVLENNCLAGLITRRSVSSLMEPLHQASFAASTPVTGSSDYLLVSDAKFDTEPF